MSDAVRVPRRKRVSYRQWFHRLIHRKCWNCNVPLEYVNDRDGRICPWCKMFYPETLQVAREARVRARWWTSPWSAS